MRFSSRRQVLASAAALAAVSLAPGVAQAQAFPSKTISLVVGYPAGGDVDALARIIAEQLGPRLKQTVVVENRIGASGTIANTFVSKAAPDGHTLLVTPNTITSALLSLAPANPPYDTVGSFEPVIHLGNQQLFLVVNSSTGIKDVKGLIAAGKEGKIRGYGTPGSGSPMHILGEMFNRATDLKIPQVPYRGTAPSVVDIVGNHIPFIYTTYSPVRQHIERGTLTAIAVADSARSPFAPNVPTLEEQGIRNSNLGAWMGLMAPKGTPTSVINTLNAHVNEILKMPEVQSRMSLATTTISGGEPRFLGRTHAAEHERMIKAVADLGIKAQ